MDMNELLAYETPKLVEVQDWKVGALYYGMMIFIIVYIFIYRVIYNLGYLEFNVPTHTVRLALSQPTEGGCDPLTNTSCRDNFAPTTSHSYCCKDGCEHQPGTFSGECTCPENPGLTSFTCAFLDGERASTVQGNSVLVQTFFSTYNQERSYADCGDTVCTQRWKTIGEPASRFVAGIENFTLLIDHTVVQRELHIFRSNLEMHGWLHVEGTGKLQQELCRERIDSVDSPGGNPTDSAPCFMKPRSFHGHHLDLFQVSTLLKAMDVSLEDRGSLTGTRTKRAEGLTAMVNVEYFNTRKFWGLFAEGEVEYIFRLTAVPSDHYHVSETVWKRFPDSRALLINYGILFTILPSGELGRFSWGQLMVTFTTSVALLAVARLTIKYVASYAMEMGSTYRKYLIETSTNFADVRFLSKLSDAELNHLLQERDLSLKGERPDRVWRLLNDGWERAHQPRHLRSMIKDDGLRSLGLSMREDSDSDSTFSSTELSDRRSSRAPESPELIANRDEEMRDIMHAQKAKASARD